MKLTMLEVAGRRVPAALLENGRLLNLAAAQAGGMLADVGRITTVMDLIDLNAAAFPAVRALVDRAEASDGTLEDQLMSLQALIGGADARYAQLLEPQIIVSCGMGYNEHLQEMNVNGRASVPVAFLKAPSTQTWHGGAIVLPPQEPDMVDFECEFSCVIGRSFHNIGPEDALAHVAGYTMINDVGSRTSAGDFVAALNGGQSSLDFMQVYVRNVLEKQFPTFCPIGPVVHTADTFGDPHDVQIETVLNGELMQSAHTSDLIHRLADTLSYFSRWYRFHPGDIVTTGSPAGVGMGRCPPRYLRPGDVLETGASRIGRMVNPVVAG